MSTQSPVSRKVFCLVGIQHGARKHHSYYLGTYFYQDIRIYFDYGVCVSAFRDFGVGYRCCLGIHLPSLLLILIRLVRKYLGTSTQHNTALLLPSFIFSFFHSFLSSRTHARKATRYKHTWFLLDRSILFRACSCLCSFLSHHLSCIYIYIYTYPSSSS